MILLLYYCNIAVNELICLYMYVIYDYNIVQLVLYCKSIYVFIIQIVFISLISKNEIFVI